MNGLDLEKFGITEDDIKKFGELNVEQHAENMFLQQKKETKPIKESFIGVLTCKIIDEIPEYIMSEDMDKLLDIKIKLEVISLLEKTL